MSLCIQVCELPQYTLSFLLTILQVEGGERALIFDKTRNGTRDFVVGPGTHFLIPFLQYPIKYDVRTTPFNIKAETGSKGKLGVTT